MKRIICCLLLLGLSVRAEAQKGSFAQVKIATNASASARYSHRGTSTTLNQQAWVYEVDTKFKDLYVTCNPAIAGDTHTFTIVCGTDTTVTCNIAAVGTTCSDTSNTSSTCNQGNLVSVKSVGTASSTGSQNCFALFHVTDSSGGEIEDHISWSGVAALTPLLGNYGGPGESVTNGAPLGMQSTSYLQSMFAFAHSGTIATFSVASSVLTSGHSTTFRLCKVTGDVSCGVGDTTNGDTGMTVTINSSTSQTTNSSCVANCSFTLGELYVVHVDALVGATCTGGTNPGTSCTTNAQCTAGGTCQQSNRIYNFNLSATGGGQTIVASRTQNTSATSYLSLLSATAKAGAAMRVPLAGTAKNLIAWADTAPWSSAITARVCDGNSNTPTCPTGGSGLEFTQGAGSTTGTGNGGMLALNAGDYMEAEVPILTLNGTAHWWGMAWTNEIAQGNTPTPTITPTVTQTPTATATPTARPGCCQPTPAAGAAGNATCPTPGTETCPANFVFLPNAGCQQSVNGSPCSCS